MRSKTPALRLLTRKYLIRVVVVNLIAAVGGVALVAAFGLLSHLSDAGYALAVSLIYAYTMGGLAGTILPFVAVAVEGKATAFRYTAMGIAIVVVLSAGCVIATAITVLVGVNPVQTARGSFLSNLRLSLIIGLVVGLAMFTYESLRGRLHAAQIAEERARTLALEARLSSLESRLHPHFLFNTLNSVSALIQEEPARAEEIVGRLAALLRFSLDANIHGLTPLEQELKIVRDYLEIEKARFGDRLRYRIEAPDELSSAPVPLLAVQTLVENSVKHAIATSRQGGEVSIRARRAGGSLAVDVADSGPGFSLAALPAEHGLDNLLARLRALYRDEAKMETITDERGRAAVCLRLPIRAA